MYNVGVSRCQMIFSLKDYLYPIYFATEAKNTVYKVSGSASPVIRKIKNSAFQFEDCKIV